MLSDAPGRAQLRCVWFGHATGRRADGLSSYSTELTTALRGRGVDLLFLAYRLDGDRAPVPDAVWLESARFKTVTIPRPGTRLRIARELERFQPDVVHLSLSHSLLDPWVLEHARKAGVPTVVTVHLPYAPVESARGRVLYGLYRYHKRALTAAERCIALSEDQRDLLLSIGCDGERIHVLPNGVDTDAFSPGPSTIRAELGAQFVVAYLGRVDPEKRVAALVEAFLRQRWPREHMLVIAGTGTREPQVRRLSRGRPQVKLLGAVHDRAARIDILRGADVFVLPSTAEGLSLSLLEAMAAGCAVIATDVAEDGTAVGDAGVTIPVQPLEPALSRSLARLHDDAELRHSLSQRAQQRVRSHYALGTRIDHLMQMYGEVSGRTEAPALDAPASPVVPTVSLA